MKKVFLTENVNIKTVETDKTKGVFDIEGLYKGYGLTLGNSLRRVLLSSLPGAAITQVKIKGVGHEFSTIKGVMEDVVEIMVNLKKVRFSFAGTEDQDMEILTLKSKGEGEVTAKDIKESSLIKVVNKDQKIATISAKGTELEMELTVEKGLGYVAAEANKQDALPVGVIQLDSLFAPIKNVNFTVENMRVGDRTDFNRLRITIETDKGITPEEALKEAISILKRHFDKIFDQLGGGSAVVEEIEEIAEEEKPKKKKATKKK